MLQTHSQGFKRAEVGGTLTRHLAIDDSTKRSPSHLRYVMRRQLAGMEKKALPVLEDWAEGIILLGWPRPIKVLCFHGRECTLSQRYKATVVS